MITIREAQQLGRTFFDMDFPCTAQDFKSAFRKAAKALHTDTSGHDSKDRFIAMKEVYDGIVELAERTPGFFIESTGADGVVVSAFLKTVDGTFLAELGLGLGPTKNGTDCPACQHKGYSEEFGASFKVCDACDRYGNVIREVICGPCRGTGQFRQRRSQRIVTCLKCSGAGKHLGTKMTDWMSCPKCRGTKTVYSKKSEIFYRKCFECSGTGEIAMFNPVMIKGALSR